MAKFIIPATTALLAGVALAATNAITYPDSALSLHLGDTVVVSYTTDYETPWMYIFCGDSDALSEIIYYAPIDVADHTTIAFDLTYDYMPTGKCFFNLRPAQHVADDNTAAGVSSPDFDYDQTEGDKQTFSSGSPSSPSPSTTEESSAKTTTAVPATKAPSNGTMTTASSSSSTTPSETGGDTDATPTSTITLPPSGGGARTGVALGAVLVAALAVFG